MFIIIIVNTNNIITAVIRTSVGFDTTLQRKHDNPGLLATTL